MKKFNFFANYFTKLQQKTNKTTFDLKNESYFSIIKAATSQMLATATKYILDLLINNEELKKFPKEFTDEAVKWVKSWFLIPEDPKATAKLEDPNRYLRC